jgi:hypothetical protein
MRTIGELKALLEQVRDNEYKVPEGMDVDLVIADMLLHIGYPDGEIRDGLIYSTFNTWAADNVISHSQLTRVLLTCIGDNHLFYRIGENGADSVFTRSFSMLFISVVLCTHGESPFLTRGLIQTTKEAVLRYITQEKDFRGFVGGKGWAHAIAHAADVLCNIAAVKKRADPLKDYNIGKNGMLEILAAVKALACNGDIVYACEEDERLVSVFQCVAVSGLFSQQELMDWIDGFNPSDTEWWEGAIPFSFNRYLNRKHFIRSLYFRLLAGKEYEGVCEHLQNILTIPPAQFK